MSVFKIDEGMTVEGSTLKQRQEIWKILYDLNMIYNKDDDFGVEISYLNNYSFYLSDEGFLADYSKGIKIKNIPFAEFKERLLTLKK